MAVFATDTGTSSIAALHDGRLATGTSDGAVTVWYPDTPVPDPLNPTLDPIAFTGARDSVSVLLELGNNLLVAGGSGGTVRMRDPDVLAGPDGAVIALEDLGAPTVAVGSSEGAAWLLNAADRQADPIVFPSGSHEGARVTDPELLTDRRLASGSSGEDRFAGGSDLSGPLAHRSNSPATKSPPPNENNGGGTLFA